MAHFPLLFVTIALVICAEAIPLLGDNSLIARDVKKARGDPSVYRLPGYVEPESYKMQLTPDLESGNFTFTGVSTITINVLKNISEITLHAKNLEIKIVELRNPTNVVVPATPAKLNPTNDFLVINVGEQMIAKSKYTLKLEYEGKLSDDMRGFYRSSYVDNDGKTRWLATTHFEPTYARRAFPCFDEPHLKATFEISIKHNDRLRAISNMHKMKTEPVDGDDLSKSITTFATTKKMSTYLVAFVVSDFDSLSNEKGTFKIWARPNAIQHGKFALKIGEEELKNLENSTNIPLKDHGFKKMESVAIPQFEAGAMENWGLVTYRESALLVDENQTTTPRKEYVATVISHEFAHQWFGDLVSPKWWQYTWLNEGFATYFQYIITDLSLPEWRLKDLQVVQALQSKAFPGDSVSKAVEMDYDVNSPEEIKTKFNSVSYQKAGSVIRMINHVVGEKNFKTALQTYLTAKKFDVATSDDLFAEFKTVAKSFPGTSKDPLVILKNWATTPGFPVIHVTRDYKKGTVNITQERYLYKQDNEHNETYYVPLNFAMEKEDFGDTSVTHWLDKETPFTNFDVKAGEGKWLIFNKQHFGYYRVNYDEQNWKLITEFLKTDKYEDIHVLNRGQLVDDALNLVRNGKLKWKIALDLMEFLKKDFDYVPWSSALTGLNNLPKTLAKSAFYSNFKADILALLEPIVKNVTFSEAPEDLHLTKLLRIEVLNWACKLGSKICTDQATQSFTNWLKDSKQNPIPPNLKSVILCTGVRTADQATWEKLRAKYLAGEEDALLSALGCSSNAKILKEYLSQVMNASVIKDNRDAIFSSVVSNTDGGVDVALDFILANADQIYQLAGNDNEILKKYITDIGFRITSKEQLAKLKDATNAHVKEVSADGLSEANDSLEWLPKQESQFKERYQKKDSNKGKPDSAVAVTVSSVLFIMSFAASQLY